MQVVRYNEIACCMVKTSIKANNETIKTNYLKAYIFFLISLIPTGTWAIKNALTTLDWTKCLISDQVLFRFLHSSLSTVRLQVLQNPPFLLPIPCRRFHCIAYRATEDSSRVCPIQLHLCLLIITSICCISAIFSRFTLDIVLGQ